MTTFTTQQVRSFLFTEQFARQNFSPTVIASFMVLAALLLLTNLSLYGQDALRTDSNGNVLIGGSVGIGVEKANQKLDVAGNANVTGNATINGQVGIGKMDVAGNATINGKVGIGTNASDFPLTFANKTDDQISLYSESEGSYGFGIAPNSLQIHSSKTGTDIVFGYGKSSALTETMRIKSNGDVAIRGKLAIRGNDNYLKLNDDKQFTNGVHTPSLFSCGSLNVGGVSGWADPGAGHVDVAGNVRARKNLYVDGDIMYNDQTSAEKRGWVKVEVYSHYLKWTKVGAPSDLRLKNELQPIPSALDKIHQLRGVTFHWNEEGLQYLTRDIATTMSAGPGASDEENRKVWQAERDKRYKDLSTTNVGVIAQDVEAVLPEAVTTDESGYKSVNYYELIPLVIEALKEEDKICQEQGRTIARQQMEMQRLTIANQAAQEQLKELQDVKQKLGHLEAAVNKFLASGVSEDQHELTSASSHK